MGKNIFGEYLIEKMDEHADVAPKTISYHKARWVLSRFMIPKWLRMPILNELIDGGLLKHNNKRELFIIQNGKKILK